MLISFNLLTCIAGSWTSPDVGNYLRLINNQLLDKVMKINPGFLLLLVGNC
jgi:hypothetical protein